LKFHSVAWDLWEHRNGIEHNQLLGRETTKVNLKIQEESECGFTDMNLAEKLYSESAIEGLIEMLPWLIKNVG
jgi:hypothetical protein